MASVQERLKLKRAPTDIWSIREQLCLASSVLKSGDQNWMSVSRSIKPIADKDSIRSSEWFSQKSCAQQYAYLLENTDIPKRKKRESGETTSELIVRRLTEERISELTKILVTQREEYQQLKNEICLLKNGVVSDEKLQKMWLIIEQEEKEKEQEQNNTSYLAWLVKQQNKEAQPLATVNIQSVQKKISDASATENQDVLESTADEDKKNKTGRSSLLTSLLKSPSPTIQTQVQTQVSNSPTIASLLCSSPKVPGPVIVQNMSSSLHQLVLNTQSNSVQERPSVAAPTLSMLLEQPSAGNQKALQQQLQNATHIINNKNLQNSVQIQNTVKTNSVRTGQENNLQISQVQQIISTTELSGSEISQIISNPIDEVMPKVMQIDKDEINEIIGDIEELIKEEITGSPQTPEKLPNAIETVSNSTKSASVMIAERLEPRNVDEPISLSNSPVSEISIEEIDSSTSNIAEIIGTAIEPVKTKINASDVWKDLNEPQETKIIDETLSKKRESLIKQSKLTDDTMQESVNDTKVAKIEECKKVEETDIDKLEKTILDEEENNHIEIKEEILSDPETECTKKSEQNDVTENEVVIPEKDVETPNRTDITNILSDEVKDVSKQDKIIEKIENIDSTSENEKSSSSLPTIKEEKVVEENTLDEISDHSKSPSNFKMEEPTIVFENINENNDEEPESDNLKQTLEQELNNLQKSDINQDILESSENLVSTNDKDKNKQITKENVYDCEAKISTVIENECTKNVDNEIVIKEEVIEEPVKYEETGESCKDDLESNEIKIEIKTENTKENKEEESKQEKDEVKIEIETAAVKKENPEPVEELDEEEPTLSKLSGGRAMKTYSKKQNATVDSETENENNGETADYRAWKKSIMLVYNRLATHKYASVFLRPITEDQAPGYHSIIFRPMDLWTIKKNIDNGTIRSTTHFQRDVMLMFQNAIMFNKHNTLVHKMTLEMQEECLQHMQVLVRAAGEASFRRETRTAASSSNDTSDSSLKRKWSHIMPSLHESENYRTKKRRKSEND